MNPVIPYEDLALSKKEQVQRMFNSISGRYDFLNRLLTLRTDVLWRKRAVNLVRQYHPQVILDVGTGTGDFAIELAKLKPRKIIGIDIAGAMLRRAEEKTRRKKLNSIIEFNEADCENLPFADNTFNLAASAFGVRNFENLEKGLSEIVRVLSPEGRILILECSDPGNMPFRRLYKAYMNRICPAIGGFLSDNKAYSYLNRSVAAFPTGNDFTAILQKAGFAEARFYPQSMGIASVYVAKKPAPAK